MMNKNIAVQDIYLLSDVKMLFEQQNFIEAIVLQQFRIFRQICENIAHPAERFIFFSYKSTHPIVYSIRFTVSNIQNPSLQRFILICPGSGINFKIDSSLHIYIIQYQQV